MKLNKKILSIVCVLVVLLIVTAGGYWWYLQSRPSPRFITFNSNTETTTVYFQDDTRNTVITPLTSSQLMTWHKGFDALVQTNRGNTDNLQEYTEKVLYYKDNSFLDTAKPSVSMMQTIKFEELEKVGKPFMVDSISRNIAPPPNLPPECIFILSGKTTICITQTSGIKLNFKLANNVNHQLIGDDLISDYGYYYATYLPQQNVFLLAGAKLDDPNKQVIQELRFVDEDPTKPEITITKEINGVVNAIIPALDGNIYHTQKSNTGVYESFNYNSGEIVNDISPSEIIIF